MTKQQPFDWRMLPGKKTTWAWGLGTFFGTGLLRPGPGTYGSAAAMLLWFGVIHIAQPSVQVQAVATLIAALAVTLVGIPVATIVARESGRDDPGHVVIDEAAGQLIALIAIPADWPHALLALLFFRLFDITKPPPCRKLERLHGGAGIMLDDVAAGVYALLLGQLVMIWF